MANKKTNAKKIAQLKKLDRLKYCEDLTKVNVACYDFFKKYGHIISGIFVAKKGETGWSICPAVKEGSLTD